MGHSGLLTLSDIAALARVQRPVVTTWRKRSRGTDRPFPPRKAYINGQEFFDVEEIVTWLEATGRGKNPDARADAAAHVLWDATAPDRGQVQWPRR